MLLLLAKEDAKAEVSQLHLAIFAKQNIIALYISVQDVFLVHRMQSKNDLVETPSDEVLAEILIGGVTKAIT